MSNGSDDKVCISLSVNESILKPESHVKVLGVTLDEKLTFSEHISIRCSKAARQLNALSRISRYLDISSCSFLAATKQLYKWYFPSVCLSVRPSVCPSVRPSVRHTFLTMFSSSYHHEIFRSYYQWQKWRPCKRSRSEVKGQGHRGHNPTLPFPDCNSSLNSHMMMKWCI